MIHILCLNIVVYVTVFPGVVFLFFKKEGIREYTLVLMSITIINILCLKQWDLMIALIVVITIPIILYKIEKMVLNKKISLSLSKLEIDGGSVIFLIPLFEELIFRYFIFYHVVSIGSNLGNSNNLYLIISTMAFVVAHIKRLQLQALYKIPFSLLLSIIYIVTEEIWLCCMVHVIFNAIAYIARIPDEFKRRSYD